MDLDLTTRGIRDEEVTESGPYVRALIVARLELIWRACEPQIDRSEGKPDPRFVESGIRVLDRLAKLYRLDQPVAGTPEPEQDGAGKVELVQQQIKELEERDRGAFS